MKLVTRIALGFLVLLVAGISIVVLRARMARHADEAYHAGLAKTIIVGSKNFDANASIPLEYTCRGRGSSPQVQWDRVPTGAASFVLTMIDWDAPTPALRLNAFTHWILYNVPTERREIGESATNEELRHARIEIGDSSSDVVGYVPPCPPLGKHRYSIRVYALDVAQIRPPIADASGIQKAMRGHIIAFGEIDGVVEH